MKINFIVVLLFFFASGYTISQSEEVLIEITEESNLPVVEATTTTIEGPSVLRNPANVLIEKNGGLIYAEVTLIGNLTHVFAGKVDNSIFNEEIERLKSASYVTSIAKLNAVDFKVEFAYGVTDAEFRLFYEKLGYSGFTIKSK